MLNSAFRIPDAADWLPDSEFWIPEAADWSVDSEFRIPEVAGRIPDFRIRNSESGILPLSHRHSVISLLCILFGGHGTDTYFPIFFMNDRGRWRIAWGAGSFRHDAVALENRPARTLNRFRP